MAADITFVICTRGRSAHLDKTLDSLREQTRGGFPVVVVDQSEAPDRRLERRADADPLLTVIRDTGRGATRARNIGCRAAESEWVVFLDDDCRPQPDWVAQLDQAVERRPEASLISGHVEAGGELPSDDYLPVAWSEVDEENIVSGRWNLPWRIGFSLCQAVRRGVVWEIGGWDELLGPGTADFPSADDMDFNYRFLRGGNVAYVTPRLRAVHEQWRSDAELGPLWEGYMRGWIGFAVKHLRTGDVIGGLWLWSWGLVDTAGNLASALKRRSTLRLRITGHKARGLVVATVRALRTDWSASAQPGSVPSASTLPGQAR